MGCIFLFIFAYQKSWFLDIYMTWPHNILFLQPGCYSVVMCGSCPRTLVTWTWSRLSMTHSCVQGNWSLFASHFWVAGICIWSLLCTVWTYCFEPKGWPLMWEMNTEHQRKLARNKQSPKFACGCCKILEFRVSGARQNFYAFSFYCSPDLEDWI